MKATPSEMFSFLSKLHTEACLEIFVDQFAWVHDSRSCQKCARCDRVCWLSPWIQVAQRGPHLACPLSHVSPRPRVRIQVRKRENALTTSHHELGMAGAGPRMAWWQEAEAPLQHWHWVATLFLPPPPSSLPPPPSSLLPPPSIERRKGRHVRQ
jgi:hypothetical protein